MRGGLVFVVVLSQSLVFGVAVDNRRCPGDCCGTFWERWTRNTAIGILIIFKRKFCPEDSQELHSGEFPNSTLQVVMITTCSVLSFITLICCVCCCRPDSYSKDSQYLNQPQLQSIREDKSYRQNQSKLDSDPPSYSSLQVWFKNCDYSETQCLFKTSRWIKRLLLWHNSDCYK